MSSFGINTDRIFDESLFGEFPSAYLDMLKIVDDFFDDDVSSFDPK